MAKLVMILARQGTVVDKQRIYQNLYILINPLQGHTVHMFGDSLNIKNTLYKCPFWNVSNQWCWKAAHNPCQYKTTSFHMWTYKPWHVSSLLTFHKGYWGYCIYIYVRIEINWKYICISWWVWRSLYSKPSSQTHKHLPIERVFKCVGSQLAATSKWWAATQDMTKESQKNQLDKLPKGKHLSFQTVHLNYLTLKLLKLDFHEQNQRKCQIDFLIWNLKNHLWCAEDFHLMFLYLRYLFVSFEDTCVSSWLLKVSPRYLPKRN